MKPLARRTLAQQAADELRDLILLEKLKPGAPIPEREMADALGVSRTPLRESLRMLATEGLIEISPNRPPRVADPSLEELQQLLQVQGTIEGLAGELACAQASDEELAAIVAMERQLSSLSDRGEPLDFFRGDMKFHTSIVEASRNKPLQQTHATYNARLWRARFISSRQKVNRAGTLEHHRNIALALQARDGERAKGLLREHLEIGFENIRTVRVQNDKPAKKDSA